jgi:hypothetical protein
VTYRWPADLRDPVAVAVDKVSGVGASRAAAGLLDEPGVWQQALARSWDDGGWVFGGLVAEAGRADGPGGARTVRLGLETIGAGLVDGDPDDRTVNRDVVEAVSRGLGVAVAAQVHVVADGLASTSSGGSDRVDLLRGLGYVTVDRQAAASVQRALTEWVADQPQDLSGTSRANPLPAVAVPAAYLAVQEYGQRLDHALDGFELQDEAEDREAWWNWTAGLLLEAVSYVPVKPVALVADVVSAYAPLVLDMDGTWEQEPDRGLRFDAEMAGERAVGTLPPDSAGRAAAVSGQAEAAYRRVAERLGDPEAPVSDGHDWKGATIEVTTGGMVDRATDELRARAGREGAHGRFGGLLPGRK